MSPLGRLLTLAWGLGAAGWASRCTTVMDPSVLPEYDTYVSAAQQRMSITYAAGDLTWMPPTELAQAAAKLASGKLVRRNMSDAAVNRRIAGRDGTIIHWVGAIQVRGSGLSDLKAVLEDYDHYDRIYGPLIFQCQGARNADKFTGPYDVVMGLHDSFRFAALLPQHYAFRLKGRMDYSGSSVALPPTVQAHLYSEEVRESASGVPKRNDLMERYHDHGILWAFNAYWRARQRGPNLYLEFETITLTRSVQGFTCRFGFVPIPKSVVAAAMESLPADWLTLILEGTRAECERRAARSSPAAADASGQSVAR